MSCLKSDGDSIVLVGDSTTLLVLIKSESHLSLAEKLIFDFDSLWGWTFFFCTVQCRDNIYHLESRFSFWAPCRTQDTDKFKGKHSLDPAELGQLRSSYTDLLSKSPQLCASISPAVKWTEHPNRIEKKHLLSILRDSDERHYTTTRWQ